MIKEALECEFIRINTSKEKFDIFVEIGKTYDKIDEIKEKNELIDKIKTKRWNSKDKLKKVIIKMRTYCLALENILIMLAQEK